MGEVWVSLSALLKGDMSAMARYCSQQSLELLKLFYKTRKSKYHQAKDEVCD